MTTIEVLRHGGRWAVGAGGEIRSEHLTREEAELEARRVARDEGGEVSVREDDPTGLGAPGEVPVREDDEETRVQRGADPPEMTRETQAGM